MKYQDSPADPADYLPPQPQSEVEYVLLKVKYDPVLVSPEFMAEHVFELEGVEAVTIEVRS